MKRLLIIIGFVISFVIPIVAQNSDNIVYVNTLNTFYSAPKIDLADNIIYYTNDKMLYIADITNPANSIGLGVINVGSTINDIAYHTFSSFKRIYMACSDGFRIIDVTDPRKPYQVSFLKSNFGYKKLSMRTYSYVVLIGANPNIQIVGFYPDPTQPKVVATGNFDGYPEDIFVDDNKYIYIAGRWGGLKIFDWTTEIHSFPYNAFGVHVSGNYAYVADNDSSLYILDVSSLPSKPVQAGHYYSILWPTGWPNAFSVWVDGDDAYVAAGASGLRRVNVADPTSPTQVGFFEWTGGPARDVQYHNGYIYVTTGSTGVKIYRETPPKLMVNPSPVDFGYARVDRSDTTEITIANSGGGELSIESISISGTYADNFEIDFSSPFTLNRGDSRDVSIYFNPDWERSYSAELTVISSSGELKIPLKGNGAFPRIGISPGQVNFGDVILGNTESKKVTVSNTGNVELAVGPISIKGIDTLEFNADTASFVLNAGISREVTVNYKPNNYGNSSAELEIVSDANYEGSKETIDLLGNALSGQPPLAGSYTIGLNGSYETFSAAVNDLTARGVSAPVIFNVLAGTYEEQIQIGQISGASQTNRITFQSLSGNAEDVTLQFTPDYYKKYVVFLNGADYITIKDMTLMTPSNSSYSTVIYMEGSVNYIQIINNIFHASNSSKRSASMITNNDGSGNSSQLNYTTITGNVFDGYGKGVYFYTYGSDGHCDNTLIEDNTFYCSVTVSGNSYSDNLEYGTRILNNAFNSVNGMKSGIIVANQSAPIVNGNIIYLHDDERSTYYKGIQIGFKDGATVNNNILDVGGTASYSSYGIRITGSGMPLAVLNNKINLVNGSNSYEASGIMVSYRGNAGNQGIIANNFVKIIGGKDYPYNSNSGISLNRSDSLNVIYNTVVSDGNVPAFGVFYDRETPTGGLNIFNNIFSNIGGGYAVSFYNNDQWSAYLPKPNSNNNDLFTTGSVLVRKYYTEFNNLADFQAYSWKTDLNSVSVYPNFINQNDLHVNSPYLNGAGTPWSGITKDIDGETRNSANPDIGADEFTPTGTTQPLSGEYTIGSGGDYPTLSSAAGELNLRGVSSAVTFNILNGVYDEQIKLFEIPGSGTSDTIVFQSQSGAAKDVVLTFGSVSKDSNYIVNLFKTSHIRFRNLTLSADTNSGADYSRIIYMTNSGDVKISNCTVNGVPVEEYSHDRDLIYGSNFDDFILESNSFNNGAYAAYLTGNDSKGVVVLNNTINAYGGIELIAQNNPIIKNNIFKTGGIKSSGTSLISDNILEKGGISGSASEITENTINGGISVSGTVVIERNIMQGGISVDCSGPPVIQKNEIQSNGKGIYITGKGMNSNNRGLIANNFITVRAYSKYNSGIEIRDNTGAIFLNIYNNTVNLTNVTQKHNTLTGSSSSSVLYLNWDGYMGSPGGVVVKNNIFTNLSGGYVYNIDRTSWYPYNENLPWNHNDVYTTGLFIAHKLNEDFSDLASWITAANQDSNSISVYPGYIAVDNLHLNLPAVDSMGTPLTEITDDIDGEPRDALFPDIGADEFSAKPDTPAPLSGIYTVGNGGDFATINEAVSQLIHFGISASVTINILPGAYIEQLQIFNIPGISDVTTVTFQSESGNSEDVILEYSAVHQDGNYVILISNAGHIRIKNLTLRADTTKGASYGRVFQLEGELNDVKFLNNVLIGSPDQGYQTDIIYSSSSLYSNNLIINGNTFNNGSYGISLTGSWNVSSLGAQVTNNIFNNNKGISLSYHDAPIINDNIVEGNGAYNAGINVSNCDSALQIQRNKIYYGNISVGSCDGAAAGRGLIANNFVQNGYLSISSSSYLDIVYNSVNYDKNNNNYGALYLSGKDSLRIQNNIFSATEGGLALRMYTTWNNIYSDNNNYFTSGINLARVYNDYYPDLDSLRTNSGQDVNSISVYPAFNSSNDLHTASLWLNNMGAPLSFVTEDIDGEPRDATTPDIGADEFTPAPGFSTPLAGNYTIGSGGDYQSFRQTAKALMQRGISASVTFDVLSGIYKEHINLFDIPGANETDTITFQSQTGNPGDVTLQYEANQYDSNYVVRLTGADRLQFKNLTFTVDTTIGNYYGHIFVLSGVVENILIKNNVLNGKSGSGSKDILSYSGATGIDGLVILDNFFNNGSRGISASGKNIRIENNIFNNSRYGIRLYSSQSLVISNNALGNIQSLGIEISSCSGDLQVTQNRISVISESGYGRGIEIRSSNSSSENRGLIANNFIHVDGSRLLTGIRLNNSSYQDVYYNSVNITGQDSASMAFYLNRYNGYNNVVDNIFANFSGGYAVEVIGTNPIAISNYNDLFTTGSVLARWQNIDYADLAALQTGSGQDANSVSIEPEFVSKTDMRIFTPELGGVGTPLAEVTDDIDGELRNDTNPDIGADEFTFTTAPVFSAIPVTSFSEDTQLSIPFSDWFGFIFDVDNDVTELTWSLFGGNFILIDAVPVGVTFSAPSDWFGIDTVNVVVSDGSGSDTTSLIISVLPINDAPQLSGIPDVLFAEDDSTKLSLNKYVADVDNDTTEINFLAEILSAMMPPASTLLNNVGKTNAEFHKVSLKDKYEIKFRINSEKKSGFRIKRVNSEAKSKSPETQSKTLPVKMIPKGSSIILEVGSGDLIISIDTLTNIATFSAVSDSSGKFEVLFTCFDDSSASDTDTILVTVTPSNDAPVVVNVIPDTTIIEDSGENLLVQDLNYVFDDIDDEILTFSAVSDSSLSVNISGDSLIVIPALNFFGNVQLIITASDSNLSVSDTVIVTVKNENDAPSSFSLLLPVDGDTLSSFIFDFLWYSSIDVDNDTLTYALNLFGNAIDTIFTIKADTSFKFDGTDILASLTKYNWTVSANDGKFTIPSLDTLMFVTPIIVGVKDNFNQIPAAFALHQNYPNPFNPSTNIKYDLPKNTAVSLKIYNVLGQEVRVLVNAAQQAGYKSIVWYGKNNYGQNVSSGIYIYRIIAGEKIESKKMLLVK